MPLTAIQARLLDAASGDDEQELSFLHSVLCQVGMPRRATDERVFERRSGNVHLRLQAGGIFDGTRFVDQPLPFGTPPRLVMLHVSAQAVKRRTRVIEIGESTREFLQQLGIDTSGGAHGGYTRFRRQMLALAACRLQLGYAFEGRAVTVNTEPIEEFDAWIHAEDRSLWPGTLTLSERFYETLLYHAVPLDRGALQALKHSALAIDVYTWLAHRLCRVSKPVRLTWHVLRDQFGQEYKDPRNFKREFRVALAQVRAVYLDARIEDVNGGILLKASPPPVRRLSTFPQ